MKLPKEFYLNKDVVGMARRLLGMKLVTNMDGVITSGIITETEAYRGETDRASHAFGGRRTTRTEVMYAEGGTAYVYLCYGIHSLFNVVTNVAGVPHAVLIRSILPDSGIRDMELRRGISSKRKSFSSGPGIVTRALGIHFSHTGLPLTGDTIWLEDAGVRVPPSKVQTGPRIGVDYAGKDALLPYRFVADANYIRVKLHSSPTGDMGKLK